MEINQLNQLNQAIAMAAYYHTSQIDKCGEPYILHPLRVMLHPSLKSDQERMVAVLHDVVEDTKCRIEDLKEFGEDVVEAIQAISHIKNESAMDYLKRVKANPLALTVKLADIEDNLSPARVDRLATGDRERIVAKHHKANAFLKGVGKTIE